MPGKILFVWLFMPSPATSAAFPQWLHKAKTPRITQGEFFSGMPEKKQEEVEKSEDDEFHLRGREIL
jgi:hypothetical protein